MKILVGILVSLALTACGQAVPGALEIRAGCLTFHTNNELTKEDHYRLIHNAELARRVFAHMTINDDSPIYPDGKPFIPYARFCAAFHAEYIFIRAENAWGCVGSPTGVCAGHSWNNDVTEIDRSTSSLVHELTHVYERVTGRNDVFEGHKDWLMNGRYDYDFYYTKYFEPLE